MCDEEETEDEEEFGYVELSEDFSDSGAIGVPLQDVRRAIGPDREAWKTALDAELDSLRQSGAFDVVTHALKESVLCQ